MGFRELFGFNPEAKNNTEANRLELQAYLDKAGEDLSSKNPENTRSFYNKLAELV